MIPRINNLHALRIFAAFLVVYCHSGYRLAGMRPFGSFSVPVFFVISGFVMALVASEQPHQFLRKRLLRAVPTYWFGTMVIFLLCSQFPLLFHSTRPRGVWLLKSLLFVPFEKAPGILEPVMFVGWTMNCEIVLYLLIALGLWVMPRRPVLFACVGLVGFMTACSLLAPVSAIAFFYSRSAMLCFVYGLVAYSVWKKIDERWAWGMHWYAGAVLVLVSVVLCALEGFGVAPYLTADGMFAVRPLVSEVGALLIVMSALVLAKAGFDVQSRRLMVLADSTFVLYLTHAYLLLGFAKVGPLVSPLLAITRPVGFLVMLGAVVGFALGVHVWMEKPAMAALKRVFLGTKRRVRPVEIEVGTIELVPQGE